MDDCIFCRIASGDVPVPFVYEDDRVVAFRDAEPQSPVHVLIVPRTHHTDLSDGVGAELAAALCAAIPKVAAATGIDEGGYRTIINKGPHAGQTVPHLHVHVLGGAQMSHGMVRLA